jgi:hypothetical protein
MEREEVARIKEDQQVKFETLGPKHRASRQRREILSKGFGLARRIFGFTPTAYEDGRVHFPILPDLLFIRAKSAPLYALDEMIQFNRPIN